jgi:hypothetical protein
MTVSTLSPEPRRENLASLDELISRYRFAGVGETASILHLVANRCIRHWDDESENLEFLLLVGSEIKLWEPDRRLRDEARNILLRQVVRRMWPYNSSTEHRRKMGKLLLMFFVAHEDHASFSGQDKNSFHEFLNSMWAPERGSVAFSRFPESLVLRAHVYAGHLEPLLRHRKIGAIPYLLETLYREVPLRPKLSPGASDLERNLALCGAVLCAASLSPYHNAARTVLELTAMKVIGTTLR